MARTAKVKWLNRHLLAGCGPYLCLVRSEPEWLRAFGDLGVPADAFPTTSGRCVSLISKKGDLACVVLLQNVDGRTPIEIAGLLVHEAVHVFQAYMDHIGERAPGWETEAYMVQALSQRLMAAYCGLEHS